jgi:hypothetical protein
VDVRFDHFKEATYHQRTICAMPDNLDFGLLGCPLQWQIDHVGTLKCVDTGGNERNAQPGSDQADDDVKLNGFLNYPRLEIRLETHVQHLIRIETRCSI